MNSILGGLIAASFVFAIIAAIIVVRDKPNSPVNRWLALFLLFAATWSVIINFQNADESNGYNLAVVRLTFTSALLMTYAMFQFALAITGRQLQRVRIVVGLGALLSIVAALSPWVISSVMSFADAVVPTREIAYYFVAGYILTVAVLSIGLVLRTYYKMHRGTVRNKLGIVAIGLLQGIIIGVLTNIILPNVTGSITPAQYGWIATALWTVILVYAVIKHHFLDIRLAIVRGVAYSFALAGVVALYFVIFALLSLLATGDSAVSSIELAINFVAAIAVALTFQPLKKFFDHYTNKIFYRENYDSEDFYANLTHDLTVTTDLRNLLTRSARTIGATLRSEQTCFFVYHQVNSYISAGTPRHSKLPIADARVLDEHVRLHGPEPIITEQLDGSSALRRLLSSHRIALLLPLMRGEFVAGYLYLGSQRGGGYTRRDVRVLKTVSDELVIAIQNALSIQEVKELNATLQQRIDAATKELRHSNAQLQRLDAAKDEFVSMASHQLRTPLTSVKGYIDMVMEGDAGKITEMQKHLLGEAFTSSERMVHLINDFLNVSRLQTGKFMIDRRPVDIAKLVAQEVDSLRTTASQRQLTLGYKADTKLPQLYLDEGKMRQVIMNFIDNALYYSKEKSTIHIALKVDGKDLRLTVKDTGIGVPESEQAQLFAKFFRASNARKQRPDGTGVGLFLAKKVITAHSGEMIFNSTEGQGSTFGFTLPIEKMKLAPAGDTNNF